jgi:hypothetical protein
MALKPNRGTPEERAYNRIKHIVTAKTMLLAEIPYSLHSNEGGLQPPE